MRQAIIHAFLIFFLAGTASVASADSPVTSTPFYTAYLELEIVQSAEEKGVIDLEIAEHLYSKSIPLDLKAAIINALSWDAQGKKNAEMYRYYLSLQYGKTLNELRVDDLAPDELFCLGYLAVMDDYFHPASGILLLERANDQMMSSYTSAIILAIARAQEKLMAQDFSTVWELVAEVRDNQNLRQDFRPRAAEIIFDYMSLYE